MKRKIIGIAAVCGILFSLTTAYSATEQVGNGFEVRIYGNAGVSLSPVSIEVYRGSKDDTEALFASTDTMTDDQLKAKLKEMVVCHDQQNTASDGSYSFSFNLNSDSGVYTAYTATEDGKTTVEEFVYISYSDFENVVDLANSAAKLSEEEGVPLMKGYITEYTYELGMTPDDIAGIDKDNLAVILYNTIKSNPLNKADRDASWCTVRQALTAQQVSAGKISDIFAVAPELSGIDESGIKDWYKKEYVTDALKSSMNQKLKTMSFTSVEAYREALTDAFILATVKVPNGTANIQSIMTEFESKIGVTASNGKAATWTALAGRDFSTLQALKEEFVRLTSGTISTGGGSSSSGSSSGGTSKGGAAGTVVGGNTATAPAPIPADIFTDIDSIDWAKDAIIMLAEKNIINGYDDGSFRPNNSIKREEFCKIITQAFVTESNTANLVFSDVEANEWYYPYIAKAVAAGIVNGIDENVFGTGKNITRQDMAVMIYRAAVAAGKEFNVEADSTFRDDGSIADYAKEAVYALRNAGAINGVTDTEFAPCDTATRAQAAKIICNLLAD